MKKIIAIALIVVLVFALASVAFASTDVVSPEKPNTTPEVTPSGETSPQTGEHFSVVWVILAAVILLAAVVLCGKKLIAAK